MKQILSILTLSAVLSAQTVVATAVPALESITKELVEGTKISVTNPVKGDYTIAELPEVIDSKKEQLDSLAPSIAAVISLRSVMEEDQLYLHLRPKNIKIVEIDAAAPLNPTLTAIGTIKSGETTNPYVWLAPSAVIRSSEIIAQDLESLFPAESEKIEANLQSLREKVRTLSNEYSSKFSEIDWFSAATMDRSFDYLIKDIGLFVTLELPGEMSWTESDFAAFRKGAADKSFSIILHRWIPFGDVATEAEKAKIPFAVVEVGFPGGTLFDNGITGFLKTNYDSILAALMKHE